MTKQEIGRFYRALLYKDGWFELSKNLSNEAAYDLYEELERFGFDYYYEKYKNASLDEENGFKEEMDKLKYLFNNRSKYLLEMSGKNSDYIEENYEKFSTALLNFCVSQRIKNIHDLLDSDDASIKQILEDFESDNEVNDMSNIDVNDNQEVVTPLTLMKGIEELNEEYDSVLNNSDLSDEQIEDIIKRRTANFDRINSDFLVYLDGYSNNLLKEAIVTPLENKGRLDAEIAYVVSIYRDYFQDDKLADELQSKYDETLVTVNNIESEFTQDDVDRLPEKLEEVSTDTDKEDESIVSKEDLEDSRLLRTDIVKSSDSSIILNDSEQKQDIIVQEDTEIKESDDLEDVLEEEDVIEELDSLDEENDYSSLSNAELLNRANNLVPQIRKAQEENSSNLRDLLLEASRLNSEYDARMVEVDKIRRAKHFRQEDKDKMISDEMEVDRIRNSKHFTQEDKERMISELYGEDNSYDEVRSSIKR